MLRKPARPSFESLLIGDLGGFALLPVLRVKVFYGHRADDDVLVSGNIHPRIAPRMLERQAGVARVSVGSGGGEELRRFEWLP